MKKTIYIPLLMLLAACGENSSERTDGYSHTSKDPVDSLFQAVMDEHDTAMSKMGKLTKAQTQISERIDSLKKAKGKQDTASLAAVRTDLKTAQDNMNEWMEKFSIDSAQDNTELRKQYLTSEKEKVSRVKEEIVTALSKADSALKR